MIRFQTDFPELNSILQKVSKLQQYKQKTSRKNLSIEINSFSFLKSGYPNNDFANGGGFVFDCRALPNPGRIDELKDFTGLDNQVIGFFEKTEKMDFFLKQVFNMVDQSIDNYLERKFIHLQVNFGCTGGKHRSVYCAEQLKKHLAKYIR